MRKTVLAKIPLVKFGSRRRRRNAESVTNRAMKRPAQMLQVFLTLASGPDGTVPIVHQTAFWIVRDALVRDGAKAVAFTATDQTWQFALDGLAGLQEGLTQRCGFGPSRPERPRRQTRPEPDPLSR